MIKTKRNYPLDAVRQAAAELLRPKPFIRVSDWAVKNVRLSPVWEATPGKYNLSDNPFMRDILDTFENPDVYEITVKKSTQVGGTLALIAAVLALSDLDPSPSMVVLPDLVSAIELRDRLYDTALESESLRHKVPREKDWNNRHIDLESCRCYISWAGSAQRLRGRACKRVFRSEVDVYPQKAQRGGNPIKASSQRVKRFHWSQIYNESSPDGEHSLIDGMWEQSDKRHWWCQCPHCNRHQVLRFFPYKQGPFEGMGGVVGYRDAENNLMPVDEALENARYKCIAGCEWNTHDKNAAVVAGMWLPTGQSIDASGEIKGEPLRSNRHSGYHLWSIHSPVISIGRVVEAYCIAHLDNSLREFFQDWLGLKYVTTKRVPEWETLGRRLMADYERCHVPNWVWFLTCGMDVQEDGVFYVIRGWGHAKTSCLIDIGILRRYGGGSDEEELSGASTDLDQIEVAVMARRFPVLNPPNPYGKDSIRILGAGIDANFRTREVFEKIHALKDDRLFAVRGDHQVNPKDKFRQSVVDKPARGGEQYAGDGGMPLWGISTVTYKDDLLERWRIPVGTPGSWCVPLGCTRWGELYLKQVTNEAPRDQVQSDGRPKRVWIVRNEKLRVDYLDCEIYASARADMILARRGLTWDASTWPRPAAEAAPTQGVQVQARDYQ